MDSSFGLAGTATSEEALIKRVNQIDREMSTHDGYNVSLRPWRWRASFDRGRCATSARRSEVPPKLRRLTTLALEPGRGADQYLASLPLPPFPHLTVLYLEIACDLPHPRR